LVCRPFEGLRADREALHRRGGDAALERDRAAVVGGEAETDENAEGEEEGCAGEEEFEHGEVTFFSVSMSPADLPALDGVKKGTLFFVFKSLPPDFLRLAAGQPPDLQRDISAGEWAWLQPAI